MAHPSIWKACSIQSFSCEATSLCDKHCNTHSRSVPGEESLRYPRWSPKGNKRDQKERKGPKISGKDLPAARGSLGWARLDYRPVNDT